MLASEFGDSTLHQQGSGEFDPLFIVTKLGAKVNRLLVAGMIESLEPRETQSGSTLWQGRLRDPSGINFFSVGDYASESMRELTLQLSSRLEDGENIMLMMTAKARFFQNEEGSIFTSLRPEEACVISRSTYRMWLVEAAKGMLNRIDALENSHSLDNNEKSFTEGGIPSNLIEGLLLATPHYGEIDLETYRLNIMQTLDIAEDKLPTQINLPNKDLNQETLTSKTDEEESDDADLKSLILDFIDRLDKGEGVDFDTLLSNAAARGHDRDLAEAALDELSEEGSVHEPRFGWFKKSE
jgi:hypothetical protein